MGRANDRKHRPTGTPKGGTRDGAGRPKGAKNTLTYGQVKGLAACRLRVPDDASPQVIALADRTLERLIAVMEEKVNSFQAGSVLKAATRIREEALGPLAQKHELTGANGGPLSVSIEINRTVAAAAPVGVEGEDVE